MSSLTETALFSKKAFFWTLVAIAAVIAIFIFFGIGKNIKSALFPPKDLPATVAFGKLPGVDLSSGFKASGGVNFLLETISDDFPALPTYGKVFAISQQSSSFGAIDALKNNADSIGFSADPSEVTSGVFKFVDENDQNRTLTVNILNGNFEFETGYLNNPEILDARPESEEAAIDAAFDFFQSYGVDLSDYPLDKVSVRKMRVDLGYLTETQAIANANLIEVNFVRDDLDKLPIIWAKENEAGISALVSERDVVFAKHESAGVLKNMFATYPLRTPASAYEDLKGGRGAFNKQVTTSNVTVIGVSLGYVESVKTEEYLVPMYLFKLADGTFAYSVAVDGLWFDGASSR